jgi:hypothetical protein
MTSLIWPGDTEACISWGMRMARGRGCVACMAWARVTWACMAWGCVGLYDLGVRGERV